jgi:ankyrin repeat protein
MTLKSKTIAKNLLQAMKEEDLKKVSNIINDGVDFKITVDDITLLTYGVMIGNVEIIAMLIQAGANINQRSGNTLTPLAHAAACGAMEEFMCLADAGANLKLTYTININGQESKSNPLLIIAVIGGSLEICKFIIKNKGDPELAGDNGISPLLASLHWDQPAIFEYLLSVGVDPDPQCSAKGIAALDWMPPLMVAAAKGSTTAVKTLLSKGAEVNRTIAFGPTALKLGVISGNCETVKALLESGANVDVVDVEGWTPLMNSATEGLVEMVELLIEFGANPNHSATSKTGAKDEGRTPLMNAAFNGQFDVVKILLTAGANVNAQTPLGASALSYALQARARAKEVSSLVSDLPKAFNSKGEAHEFSENLGEKSLSIINALLAEGADTNIRVDGVSGVKYILSMDDEELRNIFKDIFSDYINQEAKSVSIDATESFQNDNKSDKSTKWDIIRSNDISEQIAKSAVLMHEIDLELKKIQSSQNGEVIQYIDALILAISLSQESFDPIFEMRESDYDLEDNWSYEDRTASMVSGPFYTSKKYSRERSWMPIVQFDLSELTGVIKTKFGEGLLQLWYPICADPTASDNAIVVIIPKSEINPELITPWQFFYDPEPCEISIDPIPPEWGSFFWAPEGWTHTIKGVVSRGIRCPNSVIENYLKLSEAVIPKNLKLKIKKFIKLCHYKRPSSPLGEIIEVGLFGTFQFDEDEPNHYNASVVGLKCLINIPGWGDVGQAQLFYQPCNDGEVKYQFRNYWEGPGYDTTNDKNLYMGRR